MSNSVKTDQMFCLDGEDAYEMHLEILSEAKIHLRSIFRYIQAKDRVPSSERYFDLHPALRRRILETIRIRYPKATVQV